MHVCLVDTSWHRGKVAAGRLAAGDWQQHNTTSTEDRGGGLSPHLVGALGSAGVAAGVLGQGVVLRMRGVGRMGGQEISGGNVSRWCTSDQLLLRGEPNTRG